MRIVTCKIIRILDYKTIIINAGSNESIEIGHIGKILGSPETVIDPETNKELGSIIVVKGKVQVKQVFGQFSFATILIRSSQSSTSPSLSHSGPMVDPNQVKPFQARSEKIKVGDSVQFEIYDQSDLETKEDEEIPF